MIYQEPPYPQHATTCEPPCSQHVTTHEPKCPQRTTTCEPPYPQHATTYQEPKYPLFADIRGEQAVVVGAGAVAERKVETLLACGAQVEVIAPLACARIEELARQNRISFKKRIYQPGDAACAFLVICATDDPAVNEQVYREAKANKRLVNVVDVPALCNFYLPSVLSRGPLQIAISTTGASPTLAKKLRLELSERYGEEWGDYVTLLGELRSLVLQRVPGGEGARKSIFSMLTTSGLYEKIAAGQNLVAEEVYEELVTPFLAEPMLPSEPVNFANLTGFGEPGESANLAGFAPPAPPAPPVTPSASEGTMR